MKLVNVRVGPFRNILDSGPVEIHDRVTCLVGKNESGKTAFLEALDLLNPSRPNVKFNAPTQYPAWLEKRHRMDGIDIDTVEPISAEFELEPQDLAELEARFGPGSFTSKRVTQVRNYGSGLTYKFDTDERKSVEWVLRDVALPKVYAGKSKNVPSFDELTKLVEQMESGAESNESMVKIAAAALREKIQATLSGEEFRKAVLGTLQSRLPKFFYFSNYSTLPYSVPIRALLSAAETELDDDELTALSLLRMAATDDEYLLNPDYERRKRELENVGNAITLDVLEYWSQNPELRVDLDLTQVTEQNEQGQPVAVLDELKNRIRDQRHFISLPFDEHSTGFQWFFSFLAAFSRFESSDEPVVILLDEPALGLHARAQKDFLRFIEERLAPKRQVIYSTHSPFMIEPSKLDRVRVVEDRGITLGAKVTSDVLTTDPDTLFPLQAALGYDIVQHLLIAEHNVVVQGTSDFTYLDTFSGFLQDNGRTGLNPLWAIVPVGGADLIPTFVALLGHHLDVTVLVDARRESHQKLINLADRGYLQNTRIITISEITGASDSNIEDLFDVGDYLRIYNQAFGASLSPRDLTGTDGIVHQIARKTGVSRFDHGRPADELLRNKDALLPTFSTATLDGFERLIQKVNATMP